MAPQPKSKMQDLIRRGTAFLTPNASSTALSSENYLFPSVDPAIDGEECLRDCATCTIEYPKKFSIDETDKLYGNVKGWSTHVLIATGKTDWVRDVEDEKGSVMEAIGKAKKPTNGRLMLSASNIPLPDPDPSTASHTTPLDPSQIPTTVILLPAFTVINNVTPASVPQLIKEIVSSAPTTTSPLRSSTNKSIDPKTETLDALTPPESSDEPLSMSPSIPDAPSYPFHLSSCPHKAVVLLCSQKTRDARCGQSAPLLRRELERQLRPLGLYRDLHDTRPGGVGVYFISHVGGHKYSANMMIYRREGFSLPSSGEKKNKAETNGAAGVENGVESMPLEGEEEANNGDGGANQGIWLARVRPEDCEGIVKFTVLQGKVVKPEKQLRGGFDRERGLVSW